MLRNLTAEDRPKPTPCADYTCHELAEHLMTSIAGIGTMAGAEVREPESGGLESKVSDMADQVITAWRARGLDGTTTIPGGRALPARLGPSILAVELLLHGWDLAEGSGQRLSVADPLVDYVRGLAEEVVPGGRGRLFADEVEPRPDADAVERLAAYAGRSPLPR